MNIDSVDSIKGSHAVTLSIPVDLPAATPTVLTSAGPNPASTSTAASLELAHLPALSARVVLPPGYPSVKPPRVVSLRARIPKHEGRGGWLSNRMLSKVQERLAAMWASEREVAGEGLGVLWTWFDWITSSEFLTDLGLLNNGVLQ